MATSRRRKSLSVISQLEKEPYRFNFYQAVRVLEYAAMRSRKDGQTASAPLSLQAPPSQEFLHFETRQSLSFTPAEVTHVFREAVESKQHAHTQQWHMTVAFMGLTGNQGVLPYHLSEAILREIRKKNTSLKEFFEIFNHRAISMMYRAWAKYQLPASFETHKLRNQRGNDSATNVLMSLMGLGLPSLQYRQPYSDESLIPISGFLSRGTCSAAGLASMIKARFGLEAKIHQFSGTISELTPDVMSRLGMQNNALGKNTFLGASCYHYAGKFTVAITPKSIEEFDQLSPGSPLVRSLMAFVTQAVGSELVFDIDVSLQSERVTQTQLTHNREYEPTLGWNTVLGTASQSLSSMSVRMSSDIAPPDDTLPLAS